MLSWSMGVSHDGQRQGKCHRLASASEGSISDSSHSRGLRDDTDINMPQQEMAGVCTRVWPMVAPNWHFGAGVTGVLSAHLKSG